MRKFIIFILTIALMLCLTACKDETQETESTDNTKVVYCSFYPIYELAEPIFQDIPDLVLKCLVQPQDGCLRKYSLSDWDYTVLTMADMVIMGGRGLESFESEITSMEDGPAYLTIMDNMKLDGESEAVSEYDEETSHLQGANPYLYLSLSGAEKMVETIGGAMMTLDPQYADQYQANMTAYLEQIEATLQETEEMMLDCKEQPVALMQEGLIYFAEEYGLDAACRIDRENAEDMDETAFAEAISTMREADCEVVLIEKQAPDRLVRSLEAEGFKVAKLDIVTSGSDYLEAMRSNALAVSELLK